MTTTMNDGDRARKSYRPFSSDPDFRDEVRSLLLGEELLQFAVRALGTQFS